MSTFIPAPIFSDRAAAPEPCAPRMPSRFGPAVAQTKRPPAAASIRMIASELCFRTASPVQMTAPVSMSSASSSASA